MKPSQLNALWQSLLVTTKYPITERSRRVFYNSLSHGLLKLMALLFNRRPALNRYLKGLYGWTNFTVGFATVAGGVRQAARFYNGRMSVLGEIPEDADVVIRFADEAALMEMLRVTPNEVLNLILKNRMILDGNGPQRSAFLSAFFTLVGTHGTHVTFGLIWMVVMIAQVIIKGLTTPVQSRLMRLSMFWHFLDIVWIGVFTIVYLMGVL